jgi:hypothetical protein
MLTGGSNVLRLARQEDELTSSRAKCGGYTLISNQFTGNVGCFKSYGAVLLSCTDVTYRAQIVNSYLLTQANPNDFWKYLIGQELFSPQAVLTSVPT